MPHSVLPSHRQLVCSHNLIRCLWYYYATAQLLTYILWHTKTCFFSSWYSLWCFSNAVVRSRHQFRYCMNILQSGLLNALLWRDTDWLCILWGNDSLISLSYQNFNVSIFLLLSFRFWIKAVLHCMLSA